ncbi:aminopeptidase N [Thalassotalea psychrophila]|uniref:Aminopeptidase N n=1 Tax=Thalassotalea psychrophila TaxID=3065647 RepID=A0ABY9TQH2_9GAMM|nr:aminopeptidase N [Colwelliaceae bacterium SQ149]
MTEFSPRYLKDYQVPDYKISTVDLTIELDDNKTIVTNVMNVIKSGEHQRALVLDGEHMQLKSVLINQTQIDSSQYQLSDSTLSITNLPEQFTLTITTEINPVANTALEGLYKSADVYCTQCEAEGFRRITYFLDRPDVMAVYTTKIIADKTSFPFLLANGNKVEQGNLANNLHYVTWHDPFPKPCYLFALVAGNFDLLSDTFTTTSGREVKLELFVDKGNLSRGEHAMVSLKKSMLWDEQQFNLEYDLDIYMIVAVDFFNMGAMENKGLNVFNSKFVLADDLSATDDDFFNVEAVIAHEYFHNWTGNRVTCRDWFQLSLKEGLTVFRDQQFSADMHSSTVTRIKNVKIVRAQQFAEDAGPMAHPIRPEKVMEMNNFYTLTVYEKGSEVIRMMHTILGDDAFKAGIELYFDRHDGQAVTCDDFVAAMSDASKTDLSQFKLWYSQSGTPELIVSDDYNSATNTYQLTIEQSYPQTHDKQEKQNLHIPINFELITNDNEPNQGGLLHSKEKTQTWTFDNVCSKPLPALLGNFSAPVKLNYHYNDQDLNTLMVDASDEFNRWDAGQKLFAGYIKQLVNNPELDLPLQIASALEQVLACNADNAFKAEQLILPSFDEMAAAIVEVNPGSLVRAITVLKGFIAEQLQVQFLQTYQSLCTSEFAKDGQAIGNRALKNVCLDYLSLLDGANALVLNQFTDANNMTDQLAAIKVAALNDLACFEDVMTEFATQWQGNTLVMDKWFTINALHNNENVVQRITGLLEHPEFSIDNPNRARALIGAFAFYNSEYFHNKDASGYEFLFEQLAKLNTINPQVASRLITPLIQFKSFDNNHQQLMKGQLQKLTKLESLSRDLIEKLDAALK